MAIELNNNGTIISIEELAKALGTGSDYLKKGLIEHHIPILRLNQRAGQQYVALEAIHNCLMNIEE